jgi:hypothetical protein
MVTPPILDNKHASAASPFTPAALLREARRQKGRPAVAASQVCILDPDGDLVRRLRRKGLARPFVVVRQRVRAACEPHFRGAEDLGRAAPYFAVIVRALRDEGASSLVSSKAR